MIIPFPLVPRSYDPCTVSMLWNVPQQIIFRESSSYKQGRVESKQPLVGNGKHHGRADIFDSLSNHRIHTSQKKASDYTREINENIYALLDFDDETEREFATIELIAVPEKLVIAKESGTVWSQSAYAFLDDATAPDTANPSL